MGNANAVPQQQQQQQQRSNLSVMLEGQQHVNESATRETNTPTEFGSLENSPSEADSASGPSAPVLHSNSAPSSVFRARNAPPASLQDASSNNFHPSARRLSMGDVTLRPGTTSPTGGRKRDVRRCISSKELRMLRTGSPHTYMLQQKEVLNATMQQKLMDMRRSLQPGDYSLSSSPTGTCGDTSTEGESHCSLRERLPTAKERRNQRRSEHTKAVIADLCEVVTDLFIAESKLLNASAYGVEHTSAKREEVLSTVEHFVSALPPRYALSEDSPSEVLVHMRLMAAIRSDPTRAVVHIANLDGDSVSAGSFHRRPNRCLHLVTISCMDATGLLEYITKLLSTGGSRVLDADVMMSTDNIVLDRFVVEMNGRLRLDKLVQCIEAFVASVEDARQQEKTESDRDSAEAADDGASPPRSPTGLINSPLTQPSGPIYVFPPTQRLEVSPREIQDEIESAIPLTHVLESAGSIPALRRENSMPSPIRPGLSSPGRPLSRRSLRNGQQPPAPMPLLSRRDRSTGSVSSGGATNLRQRRLLVNREATTFGEVDGIAGADYLVPPMNRLENPPASLDDPVIPLIPFDELMLIENLGMGRVSTIYRAAWQRTPLVAQSNGPAAVEMVALKVATVDPETGDTSHVEELRREADIAAMLQHPNVCKLIGIAADAECFCLAYEFCEGLSLLSLLSDSTRYYEYLPIALDIANAMAYLHSRDVIHRDLKPSNVLLTRDHRAKIADFGMSVANTGQELTAETGTYRYMAPEVIRHESYSSNADVYSFGIVLWQLITREVPFATMTPIQAAFAVAEGRRPEIHPSTPAPLQDIITACWDQDSQKRPSFTYIGMALADYARMAFSPANVGAQTLQIANEMLATVEGNSTVNVDFSTPVFGRSNSLGDFRQSWIMNHQISGSINSNVGLEI